ncbi:MAG: GAF domain-containing protein [Anaerolineae bacterium]|nr:GAF domain-containing protein [Anaerolineae bacterium]
MEGQISTGVIFVLIGLVVIVLILLSASLASRRRRQLFGSEESLIPVNLASVNDAVIVATVGGRVLFVNELVRQWFDLDSSDADLWLLAQRVTPPTAFLELFAAEGQASFALRERNFEAVSHRVAVGETAQFIVVLREQTPLPTLGREERGSSKALQVLSEVTRSLNATLELEPTLSATLEGVRHLIPHDASQVCLWEQERELLIVAARAGVVRYAPETFGPDDPGYANWIARKRQSLLVPNTEAPEPHLANLRPVDSSIHSYIGVPLRVHNRFIGTLEIMNLEPNTFSQEDLALLALIAEQAAVAIENARQYGTQAERVTELSGLQKIAQAISSLQDPYQLFAQLGQRVAELMKTEMAGVLLYDREHERLIAQKPQHGVLDSLTNRYIIPLEKGSQVRGLWEEVSFWFSNDIYSDKLAAELELLELAELTGAKTTAMAAMTLGDERIGVLQVSNKEDGTHFIMEDIRLLQIYADQAAIVVGSARLYTEEQSRVAELQGLQQIVQAMSSFSNLEELYAQLTQRIAELMEVDICGILLYDSEQERLVARLPFFGADDDIIRDYSISVGKRGLAREIWREHELFVINDVFSDPSVDNLGIHDILRDAGLHTLLLAPLSVAGRRFGMLQISNKKDESGFDDSDKRLATIFAGQAAALIENARLYQDTDATLRKRAAELRSVSRISHELNATLELERILEVIAVEAQRAEGAVWGGLIMFDWNEDRSEIRPLMHFGTELNEQSRLLAQAAARSGETLTIDDFERVAHYPSPIPEARSALIAPIYFEGKAVGVISLYSDRTRGLGPSAAEYIQALCSQATIAVTNATRHAEQVERSDLLRRRAEQLTQLFELGRMFRSDQSMDENLVSVARAISETVGFGTVLMSMLDPSRETLQHVAQVGILDDIFAKLSKKAVPWDKIERHMDDEYRMSSSYLVIHEKSANLIETLGIPHYTKTFGSDRPGSWQPGDLLLVPLRSTSGEVIGVVSVDQPRDGMIPTRNTVELLEIFCNQAAIVLENSRLYQSAEERAEELSQSLANLSKSYTELDNLSQEMIRKDAELSRANELLEQRAQRLLALHRVMESIDSTRGPETVLRDITAAVVEEMQLDQCVVAMDTGQDEVHLNVIATGGRLPRDLDLTPLLDGTDPLSEARETDTAVFFDTDSTERGPIAKFTKAIGAQAILALPLHMDSSHAGALMVGSIQHGTSFSEDDRDLFNLLASQIEVEYENARLYQAVQAEASTASSERDRLQQLHLITTALQQATRMEDRLSVIARGVRSVGWARVAVMLLNDNMDVTQLVSAGYDEKEEELLQKRLLPGKVWRRRLDDPQFISMRIGSSYFLAHDHPWVLKNVEEAKPSDGPSNGDGNQWHPKDQIYLPMYAGSRIIGMINLRDPEDSLRPTEASLRPLELFVQQASSALENTRLYQETLELQSYNEAIVQSIQQGIIVLDEQGKIETFNTFLRESYQWTDEAIGQTLRNAAPALRETGLLDNLMNLVQEGKPAERLEVQLPGEGEARKANIFAYPRFDEDGVVNGAVVLIEDITQRARLEADIARRGQQLAALSDVSRRITAALTTDDVLESAFQEAKEVIAHDKIALWLRTDDDSSLRLIAAQGYRKTEVAKKKISIEDDSRFSQIIEDRLPVVIGDIQAEEKSASSRKQISRSWLGTPLISGGSVTGLMVFEKDEAFAYAPADAQVAASFANQVAVALENARLFEEATEHATELDSRNKRLALLNRISSTIGRSLDQSGILQTTADELGKALDLPQVSVFSFDLDHAVARLNIQYPSNPDGSVADLSFPLEDNPAIVYLQENKEPLIAEDAIGDPRMAAMARVMSVRKIKSAVLIPLVVGNATIGLFVIESTEESTSFEPEQIELAQTITNQAAVSVQNAQLFQETVARQHELSILFEAGRIAASSLDLDKVVNNAAGYFLRALPVDGCTISLLDDAEDTLTTLISLHKDEGILPLQEDESTRYGLKQYPATATVITERSVATLDVSSPELSQSETEWLRQHNITSTMLIPLVARDQTIGLAEVWMSTREHRFSQRDIRLAKALAASVATAMENARLLDETQKRLNELATINELSRALTQTISTEDLYEMLQERIGDLFDTRAMTIARRNPLTGSLEFPLALRNGLRIHLEPLSFGGDLYSHVIETCWPLLISRDLEARLKELGIQHTEADLKSFLGVPLISGEKVLGVLTVEDYEHATVFHEADLRVLQPIAAQVAVSMENARLYSELEQRLSETTTLQEVSRVVNSALDLQEIFERVVNELANAFKYPLIGLYMIEEDELHMQAQHGYSPEEITDFQQISLSQGIIGRTASSGDAQFVPDVTRDSDYISGNSPVSSEIAVPIISDQKVLGILDVQSGADHQLGENDLQLLQTFAGQVATAISNARLYSQMVELSTELEKRVEDRTRELREERDRIDILYKIAVELTASLDLDMVLNRALQMVGEAVSGERGSLFLIDPQSDQLIFRASMSQNEILPPGGRQIRLSRHEGMAGWVMDNRQSIVVDNVQLDPRWAKVPGTEAQRSLLGAPLVANEEVLGCIFFASDIENAFHEGHLRLVEAAANQVAASINNAELYRLIRDQAERLGLMLRSQQTEAAKSQAILESIADGVMVSDQAGEIILFNAAAERVLDLSREDVLGRPSTDLTGLYGASAETWAEALREWSANPSEYQGALFTEQIEFGNKVVSVHVSPAIHGEEFIGMVSVFRDISREVAADRIKSEFVATVSHELRTPMTSIKGYADLLLLGAAGEISSEQRRFLEIVKNNADRLSLLVNDLLDISRIEQGGLDLDVRPFDLTEIIKDVIATIEGRRGNEDRTLRIATEIPEELPKIEGDYDRITQIISNVLANAYQYTPDDGTVTVRITPDETGIQIDVIDTGIGIPDEDQPHVFERFFRGEDPMIMRTAGTGLGLAIVQRLITMHQGRISFESKQGVGTTFHVWLPCKLEQSAEGQL